jgi:hypothetical protein
VGTRRRLERLEERLGLDEGHDHGRVADEVCRLLLDQELRLIADVLDRESDDEEFPPTNYNTSAEKAAFDRFYELYEEVSREFAGAQAREA